MKIIIFSIALMMFLTEAVRADETSSALNPENEIIDGSDDQNSVTPPDQAEDFEILAPPPHGRPGGGIGRWPGGGPGRWPIIVPGWSETWTCVAADRNWEDHSSGHFGFGNYREEAARNAFYLCNQIHGDCIVINCDFTRR